MKLTNKILKLTISIVLISNIYACSKKDELETTIKKGSDLFQEGKYQDALDKFYLADRIVNNSKDLDTYKQELKYLISKSELKQAKQYFDNNNLESFKTIFSQSIDNLLLSLENSKDFTDIKNIVEKYRKDVNLYAEYKDKYEYSIQEKKQLEEEINKLILSSDAKKRTFRIIRRFDTHLDGQGMYEAFRTGEFGKVVLIMKDSENRSDFVSLYVKYIDELPYTIRNSGDTEYYKTYRELESSENPEDKKRKLDEINAELSLVNLEDLNNSIKLMFTYLFASQESRDLNDFKTKFLKSLESNKDENLTSNNISDKTNEVSPTLAPTQHNSLVSVTQEKIEVVETPDGQMEDVSQNDFKNKIYSGSINQKYKFHMTLSREGDSLRGDYYYDAVMKKISLSGKIDSSGGFYIEEYNNNELTGIFEGSFHNNYSKISGIWKNPKNNKKMIFEAS